MAAVAVTVGLSYTSGITEETDRAIFLSGARGRFSSASSARNCGIPEPVTQRVFTRGGMCVSVCCGIWELFFINTLRELCLGFYFQFLRGCMFIARLGFASLVSDAELATAKTNKQAFSLAWE